MRQQGESGGALFILPRSARQDEDLEPAMTLTRRAPTAAIVALLASTSLVAACGGDAAPTGAEGAVAEVETQSPDAASTSLAAPSPGAGPAGQTPTAGPGAAPAIEVSPGDGAPSSASSGN